jgi:hypothetical protein
MFLYLANGQLVIQFNNIFLLRPVLPSVRYPSIHSLISLAVCLSFLSFSQALNTISTISALFPAISTILTFITPTSTKYNQRPVSRHQHHSDLHHPLVPDRQRNARRVLHYGQ